MPCPISPIKYIYLIREQENEKERAREQVKRLGEYISTRACACTRVRARAANGGFRGNLSLSAYQKSTYIKNPNRTPNRATKMTTAIDRIRSKNKAVAKIESTPIAISSSVPAITVQPERSTTLADTASAATSELPPPIPCPICDCPAIWSSIYEPQAFRCCECDPPPGGNDAWHFQRGGWGFVSRRLMIVLDTHPATMADVWHWESFPRTDWNEELRLLGIASPRSKPRRGEPTDF